MALRSCFVALLILAGPVVGQGAAKVTVPPEVLNSTITNDALKNALVPLTLKQLEVVVGGWQNVLQTEASAVATQRTAGQTADTAKLDALATKYATILSAFKKKGGDPKEYQAYLDVVTAKGTSEWVNVALSWFTSPTGGLQWGINIVLFLVTLLAFKIIAGIAARIVRTAVSRARGTSELLRDFFVNTVRKVVFFIGVVVAVSFLGIDIGPFLAAMGAVGFIVGFALQGTLGNFAAGIMILMYRPYDLGHVVTVAGTTGKVDAMSLVATTLKTPDNQTLVVPNGSIWGGIITNISGCETRRVDMTFGIGYDDDIEAAEKLLAEIISGHDKVLGDPEPVIKLHELADSSVNFVCRAWAATGDYWDVYWDVTKEVKQRFDKAGISIPYPQQDVHMHEVKG